MDNSKASAGKNPAGARAPVAKTPAPPAIPKRLPPLFRRIDWLTFGITFLFVMTGYWLTLSPELTLEDSGELATGAMYAGIPHPPGYPVWTIYSWFWAAFVPFNNIAWRVALGTAFSGAVASGLLAFVVSRSSSMLIESIDDLKNIGRRLENLICLVAGFVAGTLIGFNGYMWSQAVIVEVYVFGVLSLLGVVVGLLRWVYAPHQHRYLFAAFFLYGICVNNHQSLLVIAIGMEVLVLMAEPKLGREFFFWNMVIYLVGWKFKPDFFWANMPVRVIFHIVGASSTAMWLWLVVKTKKSWTLFGRDLGRDAAMLCTFGLLAALLGGITGYVPKAAERLPLIAMLGIAFVALFGWQISRTWKVSREWLVALGCGASWVFGAAFYLYMPIAGLSNPPMQWGYPRTLDGFFHALTRGQYERINPGFGVGDTFFEQVGSWIEKYSIQLWRSLEGLTDEFNILYLLIALVVFLFYRKMKHRERAWIVGMAAMFICLGPFLVELLNFGSDRQSLELCRVFLTASHVFVAMSVGLGLALLAAAMAAHYDALRRVSIMGGICAVDLAFFLLVVNSQYKLVQFHPDLAAALGFVKILCWLLAATCVVIFWRKGLEHYRRLAFGLTGACASLSLVATGLAFTGTNWYTKWTDVFAVGRIADAFKDGLVETVHGMADAFRPDHYGLPVGAALLLLGAGAVFLACTGIYRSRAPLRVTLILFALLPSYSILTHWFSNEQRNHYFGYWFGHDMFTPPFVGPDKKLSYDPRLREAALKGPEGYLVYPEMTRDTILFGGTDPGRFCPTYMVFCDSFLPVKCRPEADKNFDRRDVYVITQNALADGTYLEYIRAHYHRSAQKARGMDTPFFQQLLRAPEERNGKEGETNILAKMVAPLDTLFARIGEHIEKKRRAGSSFFKPADFLDLNALARKLAAQETSLTRQFYAGLSPETKNLLAGGDSAKLRRALARDLNGVIEKGLYDDRPLTNEVDRRWKATFEMEALDGGLQVAMQYQMTAEVMRLQSRLSQVRQVLRQCDTELARRTEEVAQYFATNGATLSTHLRAFIQEAPQSSTRIRLNRQLLEAVFPKEIAVSPGGVYPDKEIYIPSPADSAVCFAEYTSDAARRKQHDEQFPNERPQIRGGEIVNRIGDKVQVSGQVAVMTINGLLTKVIFDQNPNNEFFVEESFPLDWMYPHLTPFGIIMKINREPVPELSEEMVKRDHEFWSKYSERLIGDWITYETPVKEIAEFAERVYLRHDFTGFKGDRKFVRDDQAQKAFSKLRSSIANSVYVWRSGMSGVPAPPQYMPKTDAARQRMVKEADFALRQAFAFCPYSPEAVFHYVQLLANQQRYDDALIVAETCLKLDPYNVNVANLVQQLKRPTQFAQMTAQLAQLEAEVRANPDDFPKALDLSVKCYQLGQVDRAVAVLDSLVANPRADYSTIYQVASAYAQMNMVPKVEPALERLVVIAPNQPDAWYNLAAVKTALGKQSESLQHLRRALELGAALRAQNPGAPDLRATLETDARFATLRATPEYKALFPPK